MKKYSFISIILLLSGCSTIHSVGISSFNQSNESMVKATEKGYGILGLSIPDLEVSRKLREQCPNGAVNGIQSTLTSQNIIIAQIYELTAIGYCSKK